MKQEEYILLALGKKTILYRTSGVIDNKGVSLGLGCKHTGNNDFVTNVFMVAPNSEYP